MRWLVIAAVALPPYVVAIMSEFTRLAVSTEERPDAATVLVRKTASSARELKSMASNARPLAVVTGARGSGTVSYRMSKLENINRPAKEPAMRRYAKSASNA